MVEGLLEKGWTVFPEEPAVAQWAEAARVMAKERVQDADTRRQWLQCEGTWFVGVDALPNDETGAIGASGPLRGAAIDAVQAIYGALPLHSGQVSVIYPGYPKPRQGEGAAAFRYRARRDAAHVDGLLPVGEARRRKLLEPHAFIIGLPLSPCSADASPLVVWEGSHIIMRVAFEAALRDVPEADWPETDLTDIYQAARRQVFDTCPRVPVHALPGQAYLIHRHALHGVAPWGPGAEAPEAGRMIAYFRPEFANHSRDWLTAP